MAFLPQKTRKKANLKAAAVSNPQNDQFAGFLNL
jgi:hypothetical protein